MKILVDEGVDLLIVERLRQGCHQVRYVAEMEPGISDEVVLDLANLEGAILLTADKDFGELVFRQERITRGIILIRLTGISLARKAEIVASVIVAHGEEMGNAPLQLLPQELFASAAECPGQKKRIMPPNTRCSRSASASAP